MRALVRQVGAVLERERRVPWWKRIFGSEDGAESWWTEAAGPEIAMVREGRGVPVMAANVGGIPEAKMGVPYLLPVRPIAP